MATKYENIFEIEQMRIVPNSPSVIYSFLFSQLLAGQFAICKIWTTSNFTSVSVPLTCSEHPTMAVAVRRVANSFKGTIGVGIRIRFSIIGSRLLSILTLSFFASELNKDPIEGVFAEIPDDSNMLLWHIWIEGPPGSP